MTIKHVAPSLVFDSGFQSRLVEWRHLLHRSPEFGFDEVFTSNFIADKLESFGVKVVRGIGKTGVLGILRKGGGLNSIGLRADMDALKIKEQNEFAYRSQYDGMMHACGHDGHSAMLLGAAEYLADRVAFSGTVYFIFQPAEEHGKGARAMINDGLFSDYNIDAVYGLHNLPGLPAGTFAIRPGSIMASESSFHIQLIGKGGHAAMPYMTVDIMLVASQIVVALQSIVSRNLNVLSKPAVVSVTEFLTDGTVNVLPSKISLKGDCRCFSDETLQHLEASMERVVAGLCASAGAEYTFDFETVFPATVNHPAQTSVAIQVAEQVFGRGKVNGNCDRFTISEDFANMLEVRPGCYGLIGNGGEEGSGCALHNPQYDFNDEILVEGVKYWVKLAETVLA
ncbi:MAG: M20 family metallopeptidase [Pseudomonadales bacterium]|nr:M20 family metallopeptidase [Pseudomonadales bacterium]